MVFFAAFTIRKASSRRPSSSASSAGASSTWLSTSASRVPRFGKYVAVELSGENKRQFFIPRGFAHGFLVLSDEAIFTYKVDNIYAPQSEASIRWDDPTINIEWPIDPKDVVRSEKDMQRGVALADAEVFE